MLTSSLLIVFTSVSAVIQLLWLSERITTKQYSAVMAVGNALLGLLAAVNRWHDVVPLTAGCTALFVWMWWHNGGGDDTKRRLKSWAGRFQGVRRTAPSHV